jgi:peptidoglycan/xylan/chitin deacetylase (PgdA/CDA1 family)
MVMLRSAGFRSVRTSELVAWLEGRRALRPRSVVITFDDGTAGIWRYADAILARAGLRGTAFVITGSVGTHAPYYLTWDELAEMRDSGRWDLEAHTRNGHRRIPIDASGATGSFLLNRQWLARQGRLETLGEFETRVRRDLQGSVEDLRRHGLGTPSLFAYPFSAHRLPTNDPRAPGVTRRTIRSLFTASFWNDEVPRVAGERQRVHRRLSRLEVFADNTARGLFDRIVAATPLRGPQVEPLTDPTRWSGRGSLPLVAQSGSDAISPDAEAVAFGAGSVALGRPGGGYVQAQYAPGSSEDWVRYRADVRVDGLASGATASLTALTESASEVEVAASAGYVSVRIGDLVIYEGRIPGADGHDLEIAIAEGTAIARVDGTVVAMGTVGNESGGVQLATLGIPAGATRPVFTRLLVSDLTSRGGPAAGERLRPSGA